MAKKKATEKGKPRVVAKCDSFNGVPSNHDELTKSVAQSSPENIRLKSIIRVIRRQQVMLDFDLVFLYGIETCHLNEQIKCNIERFPNDFMFQFTKNKFDCLKSQFSISSWGGTRKFPYSPWCQHEVHQVLGLYRRA